MSKPIDDLHRRYHTHDWVPVTTGRSGAGVWRLDGRPAYHVKCWATPAGAAELAAEADRMVWLAARGFPVPEVVEAAGSDGVVWLVSTTVPGRTAAEPWPARQRDGVVDALAELARALHAVPTAICPFDRGLVVTVPAARQAARDGLVELANLDPKRRNWTVERLVARLEATRPDTEDLVVCHGDFCLPNVLLDPETLTVTGMVDTGRLGVADRHADLALVTRSLTSQRFNPQYGTTHADRFPARYGGVDPARITFYRLLDEFF
ncbi:MAG TPA: APH(3') family aminoglycoside O-phosphotransferase [Mycobacteriales bacterium]